MNTMRAAFVPAFGASLVLKEVSIPEPGPGQVLVRVRACGVCHTDLHAATGDWPYKPELPFIPGHEAVGEVVKLGEGVDSAHVGERVGVPWLHSACGRCDYCLAGWETLCAKQTRTGYDVDGGFADYMLADARYLAVLPPTISYVHAAPLICAGVTVYKGLVMTDVQPGEWVAIIGIGGLGHLAVQYARAMGYQVIAADIDEAKLDLAASLGAQMTVNPARVDPVGYLQRQIGGAHGVLVTAVGRAAFTQAVGMVRAGGTVTLNGIPPGHFDLDIFDIVMRAITLRGSIVGTRQDLALALSLAAQEKIRPTVSTRPLEDINQILDAMKDSSSPGRIVLDMERNDG